MNRYIFEGGAYDGTETEDSPDLPEFEDFQVDGSPLQRYRRTGDVNGEGYVIYRFEAAATE